MDAVLSPLNVFYVAVTGSCRGRVNRLVQVEHEVKHAMRRSVKDANPVSRSFQREAKPMQECGIGVRETDPVDKLGGVVPLASDQLQSKCPCPQQNRAHRPHVRVEERKAGAESAFHKLPGRLTSCTPLLNKRSPRS